MAEQDVYLAVDGNVICNVCNESINGTIITAMGKTWHPNHFVCTLCHKPLMGGKFNHRDDKPYCEDDYADLFLERCEKCGKPIKEILIKAMGKNWHQEHFVCTKCGAELSGQVFCEHEGVPYCLKDYHEQFAPRCFACHEPITDTTLVALGNNWHQQCFKCTKCGMAITDVRFQVMNGQPICSRCSSQ